jgi:pimeloyl-ACP methyl ester carboxylesterase
MKSISCCAFALAAALPFAAIAQTNPRYIRFSPGATKGALYSPDSGPSPVVGILVIHRTSNFMESLACTELSARGYLVLCMNPRSDNNEAAVYWDDLALDVRSGVEFLRKQPGIRKILLWGHSGGGPTTTFYQATAENGVPYCQGTNKLIPCSDELAGLPPADGIILADAHPGNSVNAIRSLNGAVTNDEQIINRNALPKIDRALYPFRTENGYAADGASSFPAEFRKKYFAAQARRMNKLIDLALVKLNRIRKGDYRYPDDDAFLIVRGGGARLMQMDPSIHHSTARPQRLLKNDGSVATQIVESVRRPSSSGPRQNATFDEGVRFLTVRSFLSANAIRATDSMDGLDWCSSNNSVPCAVQSIGVPILITAMGAHYFIRDNEIHYELAKSADKEFIVVDGATHGFRPCTECEETPGQYSNSVKNYFDYVDRWIEPRFGAER